MKFVSWLTEEVCTDLSSAKDIFLSVDNNFKNPNLEDCENKEGQEDEEQEEEENQANQEEGEDNQEGQEEGEDDQANQEGQEEDEEDQEVQDNCSGPPMAIEDPRKKDSKKMISFITECPQGKDADEIYGIGKGNLEKLGDLEKPISLVL